MDMIENETLIGSINGMVVGGVNLVLGKKGLALYANGANQYVVFRYGEDTCLGNFILCTHGWVTALWVKREGSIDRIEVIMDTRFHTFRTFHGVVIVFLHFDLRAYFYIGWRKWYVSATPKQGWIHVVVTWQQCYGTKMYFDGELVDTYTHQHIGSGPTSDSP